MSVDEFSKWIGMYGIIILGLRYNGKWEILFSPIVEKHF